MGISRVRIGVEEKVERERKESGMVGRVRVGAEEIREGVVLWVRAGDFRESRERGRRAAW